MFVGNVESGFDDGETGSLLVLAGFEFFDSQLGPCQACSETVPDGSEGYQQCDK